VAENVGVCPATLLLLTSFKVIVTDDVATPFATIGLVPEIVELAATAAPAVNTTVPSALTTGVAIDRVLVSAVRELKVHVETPEAFELEQEP